MIEREQFETGVQFVGSFCQQCETEIASGPPEGFLLASLVFCSEDCCDEWLAMRNDGGEE